MKRGIRNNNPLNIRHSTDRWQGASEEQTDKSLYNSRVWPTAIGQHGASCKPIMNGLPTKVGASR